MADRQQRPSRKRKRDNESDDDDSDESVSASAGAKRVRVGAIPADVPGEFRLLSRDELLELSSAAFENYVERLGQDHEILPAEEREIKKQRRLIKNRESAQLSRKRKKSYIEELESKLNVLENENGTLKNDLASLAVKNSQLRGEVTYLNDMVEKSSLAVAFQDLGVDSKRADGAHSRASLFLHVERPTTLEAIGHSTPPSAVDAVEALAQASAYNKLAGLVATSTASSVDSLADHAHDDRES